MKHQKIIVLVAALLLLTGCGRMDYDETTIQVNKDGSISNRVVESFDQAYYNQEELDTMITEDVAAYNTQAGSEVIEVMENKLEEGVVTLDMKYATADAYADFNAEELFVGTMEEALNTGYTFDTELVEVKDGQVQGGVTDNSVVTAHKEYQVVITKEKLQVNVPGELAYVSENVELVTEELAHVGEMPEDSEAADSEEAALTYFIFEQ